MDLRTGKVGRLPSGATGVVQSFEDNQMPQT